MNDSEMVRALKALGDPTRFRMIQEIAAAGELSCGEVAKRFDVSQPTISHHLKILADSGLLIRRTEGKLHFTSVNAALLRRMGELLPVRLSSERSRPVKKRVANP
jgi:ArsR family transcriptional regulator